MTPFLLGQAGGVSVAFGLLGPVIVGDAVFDARAAVCAHLHVADRGQNVGLVDTESAAAVANYRTVEQEAFVQSSITSRCAGREAAPPVYASPMGALALGASVEQPTEIPAAGMAQCQVFGGRGEALTSVHSDMVATTVAWLEINTVADAAEAC